MGNRRFIALAGAAGRFLRTSPERLAQAADLTRVVRDAKGELNHGGNPAAGPKLAYDLAPPSPEGDTVSAHKTTHRL